MLIKKVNEELIFLYWDFVRMKNNKWRIFQLSIEYGVRFLAKIGKK